MAIDIEVGIVIVMVMAIRKASCSFIFNFIYELKKDIFLSPPHFFSSIKYIKIKKKFMLFFLLELILNVIKESSTRYYIYLYYFIFILILFDYV